MNHPVGDACYSLNVPASFTGGVEFFARPCACVSRGFTEMRMNTIPAEEHHFGYVQGIGKLYPCFIFSGDSGMYLLRLGPFRPFEPSTDAATSLLLLGGCPPLCALDVGFSLDRLEFRCRRSSVPSRHRAITHCRQFVFRLLSSLAADLS